MANNRQVKIGIGFDVDKNGLKELENIQNQLINISAQGNQAKGPSDLTKGLKEAGQTASKLYDILEKSYSANLGTVNVTKFKQELDKAGISVKTMKQDLAKAGTQGNAAFASLSSALLNTNVQLKKSSTLLDEMAQSMSNTVTWGITSSIFNRITNSVQDAFHYVKQLDSSLNDIRIVTDKSAESMAKFAVQANNAAKNLGASTRDYTDASLIYYQQGLGEADVAARAETTLKAANVTGQSTEEVSQQLTAVWNGYKVSAEEAELYVDKLAAVAATTASDLEELSTGMSKVASAANLMGVDVDSLNAQLATIVSVTRQAPESVGTALKTIYARMGDIEAGVDTETTLGNYTAEMEAMGFNVLDANGKLRDMSDVIEEIGNKWTTLSREQQIALSQTMAGTRQYNNLLSLFDNWDMYTKAMETSANAAGTLQKQQDTYMESTAAHLQKLSTTAEDLYDTLIKPEEINALLDTFTNGIDVLGTFFDTFGGGVKSMAAGAAILSSIFSKQIGEGLINFQKNKYQEQNNLDVINMKKESIQQKINENGKESIEESAAIARYKAEADHAERILKLKNGITNEDYKQMTAVQERIGALTEEMELHKQIAEEKKKEFEEKYKDDEEKVDFDDLDGEIDALIEDLKNKKADLQDLQNNDDVADQKEEIKELEEKLALLKQIREEENKTSSAKRQKDAQETDFGVMEENAEKAAALNDSITLVTSSLSVLATTWGAFQSLGSIWMDEDLSFGEKLAQTFGLLITSGGLLINSVGQIKDAYSGLTNIFKDASDAQAVQVKILEMLGVAQTKEAATTMTQAGANEIENATEDETQKENIESTTTEIVQAGTENNEAAATMNQVKANLTKIGSGAKEAGKTLLSKVPDVLDEIFKKLGKFAVPLALIGGLIASISFATKQWQKAQEESAKASAAQAKAQDEVIQKTNEEYNKTKELNNAYDELKEQYKNNEISTGELRLQVVDLLQQYGLEKEAVEAKTASYEELLDIMNKINGVSMNDVITENEKGIEAQKNAIKTDIWANQVEGSSKDSFFGLGEKTVDVGIISGFDDLSDILKDYEINFDLAGHVNLDDLTRVLVEDGNAFISELSNSTSESAAKLLEIVSTQQESIDAASGYQNTIDETKVEKIQEDVYGDHEKKGGFKNIEEYNNAVTKMADSLQSEGIVETYSEALEKARELLSTQDDLAASMHGWESMAGTAGATFADSVANNFTDSKDLIDKVLNETGMSIEEFSKLDIYQQRDILKANLSEDEYQKVALGFEQFKNAADDANLSLKNFYDQAGKKNPLEGLWLEDETFKAKTQDLFQYALDSGKQDLLNYFTEEDWDSILALDTAEDRMEKFQELMAYHLSDLKEDFGSTLAPGYNEAATSLISQDAYISPDNIEDFSEYDSLINNAELIKTIIPELTDEMDTLADKSKAGTEEWNEALLDVQQTMAAMAEDPDGGIFTKENAKESGLTTEGLTEAYNTGAIDEDTYNKKMTGANLADIEAAGIDEEAYSAYVDTLQDISENLEENEDMARRIATANLKQSKTIETLASDYEEYGDILKKGDKSNIKYAEGMNKIRGSVEDLFGKQISDDFITEHLEDIEKLAKGDLTVFDELAKAATEDIIVDIAGVTDAEQLSGEFANLNSMIQNADLENLEIGASLDSTGLDVALQGMLDSAAITVDECNAILEGMGFEPKIDYQEVPVEVGSVNQTTQTAEVIGPDGEKRTVSLDSITQTDGGSVAKIPIINGSSTSFRGAPKSTTPMKPKSSGRGGGGGGNKNKGGNAITDFFKDEIDIYHEINTQLEILERNYDKLHKAQEKLTGSALVDNLKEQTKAINDQIKALETKRKIAEQEARNIKKKDLDTTGNLQEQYNNLTKKQKNSKKGKELKKKLSNSKKNDLYSGNLYLEYTNQGTIANYDEVLRSEQSAIQKMEKAYNTKLKKAKKGGVSDKEQKSLDKELAKIEKAKANYEELKSSMDNYDELMSQTIADIDQKMQDLYDQKIEIQIETFDSKLKLRLDSSQLERDYNDFLKEINEDDDNGIVEDMKINTSSMKTYQNDISKTKQQLAEAQAAYATISNGGIDATFGNNAAAALEKVKEYQKLLTDQLLDYKEVQKEVHEQYLDLLDSMNEQFDEQYEAYERINDELEHLGNLQSKLLGEQSYDEMNKILDGQIKNSQAQINAKKKEIDAQKKIRDAAKEGSDEWKKANERILQAEADIRSLTESTIDAALTRYENRINKIFDDAEKKVAGMSFEEADKEWESFSTYDNEFLDGINRAYGINDFKDRAEDAINSTNSIKAQEMLNALKDDELNKLKEKNKLTQYDVDRANKMLDITLKQIALEEAQNNKSKMRLRRDSQGNYSYQYVADNDQVDKLQDELDKAKNELYNFDKEEYKENVQKVKNQYAMMQEELKELMLSEDYKQADKEIQAQMVSNVTSRHEGIIQGLVESNNRIRTNIEQSALDEALAEGVISQQEYDNMTVEQKENFMNNLLGIWDSGYQNIANLLNGEGGFSTQVLEMLTSSGEAVGEFKTTVNEALGNTGEQVKEWATLISDETSALTGENGVITKVNTAFDEILTTFTGKDGEGGLIKGAKDTLNEVNNLATGFKTMAEEATKAAAAAKDAINASNEANASAAETATNQNTIENSTPPAPTTINQDNGGTSTSSSVNGILEKGDRITLAKKTNIYKYDSKKKKFTDTKKDAAKNKEFNVAEVKKVGNTEYAKISSKDNKWVKKSAINTTSFDTGGYTGDWKSSDGRLAFLHKKELVLNAKDTENMLKMLDISRSMTSVMSSVSNKIKDMIYQIDKANYIRNMNSRTQLQDISNQLEQKVHIEATFPNVSQSHEIEDAFNNLINIAAQRAYRTKR